MLHPSSSILSTWWGNKDGPTNHLHVDSPNVSSLIYIYRERDMYTRYTLLTKVAKCCKMHHMMKLDCILPIL